MNPDLALQNLIKVCELAQKAGCLTIQDAVNVSASIQAISLLIPKEDASLPAKK